MQIFLGQKHFSHLKGEWKKTLIDDKILLANCFPLSSTIKGEFDMRS